MATLDIEGDELFLLVPACLQSAPPDLKDLPGPWEQFLARHRNEQLPWPKWSILARLSVDASTLRSETLLRLLASGELELDPIPDQQAEAIWTQNEWGREVDWALLSPSGGIAATGSGMPAPESIEEAIQQAGWKSRAQRFEEFIQRDDGTGEAWGDAMADASRLGAFIEDLLKADADKPLPWWIWEPPPPDRVLLKLKGSAEREWVHALEGLRRQKGYERWPGLAPALALAPRHATQPRRDALRPLLPDLLTELHRRPQSQILWNAWSQVARRLPAEASEYTPSLFEVPPGDPWPPPAGVRAVVPLLKARGDLPLLLSYCRHELMAPLDGQLATGPAQQRERLQRIQDFGLPGLAALVAMKAESDGLVWIEDLRRMWGKDWATSNLRAFIRRTDRDWLPESWNRALHEEPLEEQPLEQGSKPSAVPTLVLDAGHDRRLERSWQALRKAPALDDWGPSDLQWTSFSASELRRLQNDYGLDSAPRWYLMQGRVLIASGTRVPDAAYLQERLRSLRVPRLEALSTFISRNPDQLEARAERFGLLRKRMPQPRLEEELLADAEAGLFPVASDAGWAPSGASWAAAAQRVLPRLEQRLQHWPSDLSAWRAWISWSALHPLKPLAVDLADRLRAWPALPFEVTQLIAGQLRERGAWERLQAFSQDHWNTIVAQAQPIHPSLPQLDLRLSNELEAWLAFLESALEGQGQGARSRALQQKFTELTQRTSGKAQ